ncbi:unnamed protein product [Discosporangium mesarthrocarpum]
MNTMSSSLFRKAFKQAQVCYQRGNQSCPSETEVFASMTPRRFFALAACALAMLEQRTLGFVSSSVHMSTKADGQHGRRNFITKLASGVSLGLVSLGLPVEQAGAVKYQQEYLTEPTAEFKAIEASQAEFAKAQRLYKADFNKKLDGFLEATTDDGAIESLKAMTNFVRARGGLPEGVKINDLLKTCRRKKGEMKESGKWGTPVQIAYEVCLVFFGNPSADFPTVNG